ncbi:SulP family inorganic anion transporter [Actinoalloteichus hymeniacidonis]|uniref:SulP family inorganic anion transporter n=1 Tax=Actinoalloteichus hymeniacidonis TaxID=340345 RepID=UPI00179BF939|nr:SulP family inorganic anion transporter [Actinoalloteichus hymeniacidonis]MBB5908476.1 SulP family sulfate permease [Actinoalloteichus hymeniacidonis]
MSRESPVPERSAGLRSLLPGRSDWRAVRQAPRRDLIAGVTVAVVALPLALAFGISSGLGAEAGLITAIVAGALASIFGGSNLQVSGPTGAMTVVLVPIVGRFGVSGVLLVGLLAGVLLIVLALTRAGRVVRLLPTPVIVGFTAGIAIVIALQQVPAMLGVDGLHGERVWATAAEAAARFLADPQPVPVLLALGVALVTLVGGRRFPAIPFSLPAVVIATLAVVVFDLDTAQIGELPTGLPGPALDFVDLSIIPELLPSAVAVAALAALESLLSATVADGMSDGVERHDPDRELFGQGVANLVVPLFGGVPATAAIARTAVNVRSGARSRLAAFVHAVVLALVVFSLSAIVGLIPLAALAGVLLATTVRMVAGRELLTLIKATPRDAVVLVVTLIVTVAVDLISAVVLGVAIAVLLATVALARGARGEHVVVDHGADRASAAERPDGIVAHRFDGPLFFATADGFRREVAAIERARIVILRMSRISGIDATGAQALDEAIEELEREGVVVLLSELRDVHARPLLGLPNLERIRTTGRIFLELADAVDHARTLARRDHRAVSRSAEPHAGPDAKECVT